jgi:hypothetical protein
MLTAPADARTAAANSGTPLTETHILPEAVHGAPLGQANARLPDALMHHTLCVDEIADGNVSCDVPQVSRSRRGERAAGGRPPHQPEAGERLVNDRVHRDHVSQQGVAALLSDDFANRPGQPCRQTVFACRGNLLPVPIVFR